jgi:ATP-dependent Zn protease
MSSGVKYLVYAIIFTAVAVGWVVVSTLPPSAPAVTFSEFISWVDKGVIARVEISGEEITGITKANERFRTRVPPDFDGLAQRLIERRVMVEAHQSSSPTSATMLTFWIPMLLFYWAPTLVLIVMMVIVMRRLNGIMRRLNDAARQPDNGAVS